MKKFIPLLLVMVVILLVRSFLTPAHAQESVKEEKPTFYRLIPGTYVNGWPRFTMTYPKDWVETRPRIGSPSGIKTLGSLFGAKTPEPTPGTEFGVFPFEHVLPLGYFAEIIAQFWRSYAKDVTVLSNKPSQLRDGTSAREVELQMVLNGEPYNWLGVATKKGDLWINANVGSFKGKIGEDLRAIPYSLQYEPGKDEPVKVPPDVQEFLDRHCNAIVSHDVAKVMTHYSDRFLNSGVRKGEMERSWRQIIGPVTSVEVGITDFVATGDRAYLAGFISSYWGKQMLRDTSIIKENGEWKFYGNQRDISP
jgi:hypothetical protein